MEHPRLCPALADAAAAAGVELDIKGGRHYTASQLLAGGFDLRNTAARLGHTQAALILHERLTPWRDRISTVHLTYEGSVAHYLGLLEHVLQRYEDAERSFAFALEIHERMNAAWSVAMALASWISAPLVAQ